MRTDPWSDRLIAIVSGRATSADIERWIEAAWREGRCLDVVSPEALGTLPASGRPVTRYGDSGVLRSEVCFGRSGGPGGVVVRTPAMEAWSRVDAPYCIAPHVHRNSHLTVVLEGRAHFLIERSADGDDRVLELAVRPGDVLPCPAGVAHTFGSAGEAFTVLSIQARFVDPSQPDFARNVRDFGGLPCAPARAGGNENIRARTPQDEATRPLGAP